VKSIKRKLLKKVSHIKKEIKLLQLIMKHEKVPWYSKFLLFLTIDYIFSPIDLIPDFIPVIGLLDDIIIVPFLLTLTIRSIPNDLLEKYRTLD
jgi:uncharacterized membrane protein YkvA (DUF1232 family)